MHKDEGLLVKHHKPAHIAKKSKVNHCSRPVERQRYVHTTLRGLVSRSLCVCRTTTTRLNAFFFNYPVSFASTLGGCRLFFTPRALASSSSLPASHLLDSSTLPLYLCLTPYIWRVSTLKRHTLSVALSRADSLALVLTDSVGREEEGCLLARYTIRRQMLAFTYL